MAVYYATSKVSSGCG